MFDSVSDFLDLKTQKNLEKNVEKRKKTKEKQRKT